MMGRINIHNRKVKICFCNRVMFGRYYKFTMYRDYKKKLLCISKTCEFCHARHTWNSVTCSCWVMTILINWKTFRQSILCIVQYHYISNTIIAGTWGVILPNRVVSFITFFYLNVPM